MAREKGLDLVIVSPNQAPPVAKIIDYGKYKFETEKELRKPGKSSIQLKLKN